MIKTQVERGDGNKMLPFPFMGWVECIAEGRMKGRAEGRVDNLVENIHALMETLGLPKEKAMDVLKVSEEDRAKLSSIL